MSDPALSHQTVAAIAGGVGVLLFFYFGHRRQLKLGEGSRMGLNLSAELKCSTCSEPLPRLRRPRNFRQMMWGGWTCEKCGSEFDKWLQPVVSSEK
ncbi:MAG: hypothetical protein ACO1TE_24060 [Prosthecobacter sp.]